jgi:predicted site-specific integrase-resolvase
LARQEQLLKNKYPEATFISDIASGFNQSRRGYKTILESDINGNPQQLVATTSDRITRTGFQLIIRVRG